MSASRTRAERGKRLKHLGAKIAVDLDPADECRRPIRHDHAPGSMSRVNTLEVSSINASTDESAARSSRPSDNITRM